MNWQKLPNGILLKNAPIPGSINETDNANIQELGYSRYEIYTSFDTSLPLIILGYFKIFTKELIAIHRNDNLTMSDTDIKNFLSEADIIGEINEENVIKEGIDNQGISQSYIESICGRKAHNDIVSNDKYVFKFKNGFLSDYSSKDGISGKARKYLNIDSYIQVAKNWYNGDMSRITNEINLHAECLCTIGGDIIRSSIIRKKFSYSNGWCNWIAMAAHYKTYDVSYRHN